MPRLMLPSPRGKWRQERLSVAELLCSHQQLFITSLSPSLLYSFSPFNLCVCHSLPPSHSLHVSFCCHLSLSSFHFLPDLFSFLFWVMAHLHVSSFPPSCVVHPLFSFNPFLKFFFAVAPPPHVPYFVSLSSSHLFLSLIPQLFPLSFFSFLLSILLLSIFFSFISTFPASFSPFPLLSQFHSSLSSPLSSFFIPPIFPFTHRSLVSSFTSFPFLFVFPLPSFLLLFSCLSPLLFAVHLSLILSLPNYFPPYITHLCSSVISQLFCSYLLFPWFLAPLFALMLLSSCFSLIFPSLKSFPRSLSFFISPFQFLSLSPLFLPLPSFLSSHLSISLSLSHLLLFLIPVTSVLLVVSVFCCLSLNPFFSRCPLLPFPLWFISIYSFSFLPLSRPKCSQSHSLNSFLSSILQCTSFLPPYLFISHSVSLLPPSLSFPTSLSSLPAPTLFSLRPRSSYTV